MGKKNKKEKFGILDYMGMGSGKLDRAMDRYEVEGTHYGHPDGRSGKPNRSMEDVSKDLAKKAMGDYDTRRSVEAMALQGNEKAQNWAKNGFKSAEDVAAAQKFFEKQHKKNGNGGSFSSNSDYAGLTWDSVKNDRDKLIESLSGTNLGDKENGDPAQTNNFYRSDYPSKRYAELMGMDDEGNLKEDSPYKASNEFRQSYTADVVAGLGLEEQTGLNLSNAMAFVNERSDDGDDDNRYYRGYGAYARA